MSLYLTKVLALLALPLGWALLLSGAGLLLLLLGRRRLAGVLFALQFGLLWMCSMPWTADRLMTALEAAYPPVAVDESPAADAAVVLGGALNPLGAPPTENLSDASDRVLRAARLFRAGKVRAVLVSGGRLPWLAGSVPEAELMRDVLVEWGVPRAAVVTESVSQNTRENALMSAEIIRSQGWRRVLLVTSAAHMPRSVAAFRGADVEVIPSPTDYRVPVPAPLDLLDFLPDAGALAQTSAALREVVGQWFYWLHGWIS